MNIREHISAIAGANLNVKTAGTNVILICAAKDLTKIIHILVESTLLIIAAHQHQPEIVEYLISNGALLNEETALFLTCTGQHGDIVSFILRKRASVNASPNQKRPPLCNSSFKGHVAIAEILLFQNAKI